MCMSPCYTHIVLPDCSQVQFTATGHVHHSTLFISSSTGLLSWLWVKKTAFGSHCIWWKSDLHCVPTVQHVKCVYVVMGVFFLFCFGNGWFCYSSFIQNVMIKGRKKTHNINGSTRFGIWLQTDLQPLAIKPLSGTF